MAQSFSRSACRIVPQLQKVELSAPSSRVKLSELLPPTTQTELWGPSTTSAEQGDSMLRDAVARHRGVFVVECGYNGSGRDPLSWSIGGSKGTDGPLSILLARLCAGGGVADVSLAALDLEEDAALDLFAPFVSGGKANTLTAASITSVDDFRDLIRKAFAAPAASKVRACSFAIIVLSAGIRHTLVLLTEEHHAKGLKYFTDSDDSEARGLPADAAASSSLLASTVLKFIVKLMSAKKLSDGSTVRWQPFVVVRIGADQRQDPLGVFNTIFRPNTPTPTISSLTAPSAPIQRQQQQQLPTPVPQEKKNQQQARASSPPRQQLSAAEAEKLSQDIADLRKDINHVDSATRQVLEQHKLLRETLHLRKLEFESGVEARAAAQKRVEQLRNVAESTKRDIKLLDEQLAREAELEKQAELSNVQSKKVAASAAINHARMIESLREKAQSAVEKVRLEAATKLQETEAAIASAEDELRSVTDTMKRKIAFAEEEKASIEAKIAEAEQQRILNDEAARRLEKQRSELELQGADIRRELAAKSDAEQRLELARREHDDLNAEVTDLRGFVDQCRSRSQTLAAQISTEEMNAQALRQAEARTGLVMRAGSRLLLEAESDVGRGEIDLAEARIRTDLVKVERRHRQALHSSLPVDDVQVMVTRVLSELRQRQHTRQQLLEEKDKLERTCLSLSDRLQTHMTSQEAELGQLRTACSRALERVEQLRRRQRVHFAEKEARLNADKATFHRLFDEFLVQMDDESISAAMRSPNSLMMGHIDTRSSSPPPTNPSSSSKQQASLTLDEKGEICGLYLSWADQCHKVRDAELEATRGKAALSTISNRIDLAADELTKMRQKIATMEDRMHFMQDKEVEANAVLDDFVASSQKQRHVLECAIEQAHLAAQEEHALAVTEVAIQTAAVEAAQRELVELQIVLRSLVAELEESKQSSVVGLTEQLSQLRQENLDLEARVAGVQRAKKSLQATPDVSIEQAARSGYSTPRGSDLAPTTSTTRFHF